MEKKKNILQEYDKARTLYDSLCIKAEQLIKELLNVNGIITHHISHRTKDRKKIEEKIVRKGYKYSCLNDITDISGIRIITYFAEDVDKVADIIKAEFNVDVDNTIDKRNHAENQFGYMSMHYVVSISNTRLELAEYKLYKELKFEIQIRSVLQHGWAEIEHDLGYKEAKGIPAEFKRDFNRISALLETADNEFDRLRNELFSYDKEVIKEYKEKSIEFNINNSTLKQFIMLNKNLLKINKEIAKFYKVELNTNIDGIEMGELSEKLKYYRFESINQLDDAFEKNIKQLIIEIPNLKKNDDESIIGVNLSVGIFTLIDMLNKSS